MFQIKKLIVILTIALLFLILIPNVQYSGNNIPSVQIVTTNRDLEPPVSSHRTRGNEPVTFQNVSVSANLTQHRANHFAWGDYNNDGYQDLLINSKLLRNNGPPAWDFTDVTAAANISGGGKGTWADYDNDGYLDFYTTGNKLWHNSGTPNYVFADVTLSAGNLTDPYPTTASGWGDFDRDGDLDLYVVSGEEYISNNFVFYPDVFYENNGDGTFNDKTDETGLDTSSNLAYGRSVNWGDYNNDGWIDIQVGNYRLRPNYLWRNNHDGTFIDVAPEMGTTGDYDPERYYDAQAESTYGDGTYGPTWGHTIGSAWGDLNNDGDLDLWDSNLVHKYVGPSSIPSMPYDIRGYVCDDSKIYFNEGGPLYNFTDVRASTGIPFKPIGGSSVYQGDELWSGIAMGDYDNDGDLDIFVPQIYDLNYAYSLLFRNNNDGTFTDVAQQLNLRVYNTYGATWCDYDNDGFLDLAAGGKAPFIAVGSGSYETHIFKNQGNTNKWLKVRLIGQDSNQLGMGARIITTTGQLKQVRQVEGGMGSHSQQNEIIVHFGLGSANIVNKLEVQWPNGRAQILNNVQVNQQINITENLAGPEITSISVSKTALTEDEFVIFDGSATDADGSITKYEWDFDGDNNFDWSDSTSPLISFSYNKSGVYCAKLRVWDDSGILYTDLVTDFITVTNSPPVAEAGSNLVVWEDEIIVFDGSGSTDTAYDQGNLLYNWSFGDNTYSDWQESPYSQHSYPLRGNYDVTMIVRDDDNESDLDTLQITIKNKPPWCEIQAPKSVFEDSPITFSAIGNDTSSDLQYIIYRWDFGDGNQSDWLSENSTTYVYPNNGTYIVRCTIRDDEGMRDENFTELMIIVYNQDPECFVEEDKAVREDNKIYLNGTGNDTTSDLATLSYLWDFDDGTISKKLGLGKQNITHVYTKRGVYHARLIVTDDDGAECIKVINVTVKNVKPKCWAMEDVIAFENDAIRFTGSADDTKSDLNTLEYSWAFGVPGQPSTAWNASPEIDFSYVDQGVYEAILTVHDDDYDTANATVLIRITNVEPIAKFLMSSTEVNEDQLVEFNALQSTDSASDIETLIYTWDFGDKSAEKTGSIINHRFFKAGEYRISLLVTDDNSDSDSFKRTIKVKNVIPTAVISISTEKIYPESEVIISGAKSSDTSSDIKNLTFDWEFGDGNRGKGRTIIHSYKKPGRYDVKLKVMDDDGSYSEDQITITVSKFYDDDSITSSEGDDNTFMAAGIVVILLIILIIILILIILKPPKAVEDTDSEGKQMELITPDQISIIPPGTTEEMPPTSTGEEIQAQAGSEAISKPPEDIKPVSTGRLSKTSKLTTKPQETMGPKSLRPRLPKKSEAPDRKSEEGGEPIEHEELPETEEHEDELIDKHELKTEEEELPWKEVGEDKETDGDENIEDEENSNEEN